jgi:hypothetical protein
MGPLLGQVAELEENKLIVVESESTMYLCRYKATAKVMLGIFYPQYRRVAYRRIETYLDDTDYASRKE